MTDQQPRKVVARRRPADIDAAPPAPTVAPVQQDTTVSDQAPARRRVVARRALGDVPTRRPEPRVAPVIVAVPEPPTVDPAPVTRAVGNSVPVGPDYDTIDSEHAITPGRVTPPERFDPDNAWDFADLDSPVSGRGLDAAHRLDPYWDGLWGAGSAASWLNIDLARRQAAAGLGRLPGPLDIEPEAARQRVLGARGWQHRLALLGALFSYRTMTAEQAAAFVGDPSLSTAATAGPASLFASGLLDLGVFSNGLHGTDLTGRGALYRPSKGDAFDEHVKDHLSWPEWVSVTGGQRWTAASNYDRHNVLGTELALRLAEYTEVGTVLGERFSSVDHLAGSGIGYPEMVGDQRAADLTAIRRDGMRIVFEMTANVGTHFSEKVRRWARLLAERPLETSGLTVVFVIVQHPERMSESDGFLPRARTYQAIAAATKEFPGSVRDRVAERIGVATWREWFPARGKVHDAFFTLRVDRPTGTGDRLWEPADMLDASEGPLGRPFTAHDPAAMTAILDNAALLGNTPHWLRRQRTAPELWPLLLDGDGDTTIPQPTPVRPNRIKGRTLGQGVGVAGDAKPPKRLLGLAA